MIPTPARSILGHPPGLMVLCLTQIWERFSYYGMRALLVLYLAEDLLQPGKSAGILGYSWFASIIEAAFGPLSPEAMASQIFGLYTGLVYFTPLLGGMIADRYLGQRRAVFVGGLLIALGHALMAFDATFLLALAALILGSGLFTPTISAQVAALYEKDDSKRDRAFSLFYVGINLGAILAPLICGTLGETISWHLGFSCAALGMVAGLVVYARGAHLLPADQPAPIAPAIESKPVPRASLILLLIVFTLFWTAHSQSGDALNFWLRDNTDLTLGLGITLKITWFQALNPLFILAGTPIIVALWARAAAQGREASTPAKIALGGLWLALAFVMLAIPAWLSADGSRVHWLWTCISMALLTLGELYFAPTSWSYFGQLAPKGREGLFMGLWLLPLFFGGYLTGILGTLWSTISPAMFWLLMAAFPALGALVTLALQRTGVLTHPESGSHP